MASGAQLDKFDRLDKKHKKSVERVQKKKAQALPIARAQLAAALYDASSGDIALREGFDPDSPEVVLSSAERSCLPAATRVVDSLIVYVQSASRLENQRGPQVAGYGVTPGRI